MDEVASHHDLLKITSIRLLKLFFNQNRIKKLSHL